MPLADQRFTAKKWRVSKDELLDLEQLEFHLCESRCMVSCIISETHEEVTLEAFLLYVQRSDVWFTSDSEGPYSFEEAYQRPDVYHVQGKPHLLCSDLLPLIKVFNSR